MLVLVPHMNVPDLHQFQYSTDPGQDQAPSKRGQHGTHSGSASSSLRPSPLPTAPASHVNAISGPSRHSYPASVPTKSRTVETHDLSSGDDSDFPRAPPQGFLQPRHRFSKENERVQLDYAQVCARQATALRSRLCHWYRCGRELASLAQLIQHCKLHVTEQGQTIYDVDNPLISKPVSCAWGSCAVQSYNEAELIDHVVQHAQHHKLLVRSLVRALLILLTCTGCTYRERTLTAEHVSSHSDLGLESLILSARPTFNTAPVPRTPPLIPASYAHIPSSEIYATVVPARRRDIGINLQDRTLHDDYFQGRVDARSWDQRRSSTIFRPSPFDPIPPFEPIHPYLRIGSKTVPPRMAPAPSFARGGQIMLSLKKRKRQALSIPAEIVTLAKPAQVRRSKRTRIASSCSEELDREAAAIAGQSIGFKYLVERLRLEGKMDETSRDRSLSSSGP